MHFQRHFYGSNNAFFSTYTLLTLLRFKFLRYGSSPEPIYFNSCISGLVLGADLQFVLTG